MAYPDYTNNFDSKWKDQSTPCKYDVDDPTFCSPMSVLSGLVSGFCERQAVINSSFVTGTTASPVTSDWYAATQAGRDAIVDSCVQHVACHDLKPSQVGAESYKGPVDGSFHAVDHASVQDGGVTKTTTYMTHMDGLIDSLVQTGEYRTDITGATAYTTFDQLAASASAAVTGTVSACSLAVSGGTAYSSEFMPAFPKAWALERKWMLEQLRYTVATVVGSGSYTDLGCQYARASVGGIFADDINGLFISAFARPRETSAAEEYFCASAAAHIDSQFLLGRRAWMWCRKNDDGTISYNAFNFVTDYTTAASNAVYIPVAQHTAGDVVVHATYAQGGVYKFNDMTGDQDFEYVSHCNTVIDGSTVTAGGTYANNAYTAVSCYVVKSGGVLEVPATARAYTILVSEGGLVHFTNGGCAEQCIVLEGGTITGYVRTVQPLCISGMYPMIDDMETAMSFIFESPLTLPQNHAGYNSVTANATYSSETHGSAVFIEGGTLTLNTTFAPSADARVFVVAAGGTLLVSGTPYVNAVLEATNILVLPGGHLRFADRYETDTVYVTVCPKGSMTVNIGDYGSLDGFSRLQFGPDSVIKVTLAQNKVMGTPCVLHCNPGKLNADDTIRSGIPLITVSSSGAAYSGAFNGSPMAVCLFNNMGMTINGSTVGVIYGSNVGSMTLFPSVIDGNGNRGLGILHMNTGAASIDAGDDFTGVNVPATFYNTANQLEVVLRCTLLDYEVADITVTTEDHYPGFKLRQNAT